MKHTIQENGGNKNLERAPVKELLVAARLHYLVVALGEKVGAHCRQLTEAHVGGLVDAVKEGFGLLHGHEDVGSKHSQYFLIQAA